MLRRVIPLILILSLGAAAFLAANTQAESTLSLSQADEVEAQQAIDTAQAALYSAFSQVRLADLAGAQIGDLITSLNAAINDLSIARTALNTSDYTSAIAYANNTRNIADSVNQEAQNRRITAQITAILRTVFLVVPIMIAMAIAYVVITQWRKREQQRRRDLRRMEIRLPEQDEGEPHE